MTHVMGRVVVCVRCAMLISQISLCSEQDDKLTQRIISCLDQTVSSGCDLCCLFSPIYSCWN